MSSSTGVPNQALGTAIVIPIRSFDVAKQRLAPVTTPEERADLMRELAGVALRAGAGFPIAVVTSDDAVRRFVGPFAATVLDDPGSLNTAADAGRTWAQRIGAARVVVVHADLPFLRSLHSVTSRDRVDAAYVVADHRGDGTPVLSLPTDSEFEFSYGPGSFLRHCEHARAAGLDLVIIDDETLGFDVDLPEDLAAFRARHVTT